MAKKTLTHDEAMEIAGLMRGSLKIQNEIGFGDMNIKAPDIDFYPDMDLYFDPQHHEIHLGVYGIVDIFGVDSEADFYNATNYGRGHEEQHCRSTATVPYGWGISRGIEVVLEYISSKEEKSVRRFRSDSAYEDFANRVLPGMGIHISYQMMQELLSGIANSVEDGRIERIRAARFPGFEKMRIVYRGRFWESQERNYKPYSQIQNEPAEKLTVIMDQILSLATCQLYSKGFVQAYAGTPLVDEVKTLMPHIALGVMAGRTRDMAKQVVEIARLLAPYIYETCKVSASNAAARQALEQLLKDLVKKMLDAMPNTGLDEKDEDTDDGGGNSTFPNSDLEITLDDETYDKLAKNSGSSGGSGGLMIKREHPKNQGDEQKDDSKSKDGKGKGDKDNGQSGQGSDNGGDSQGQQSGSAGGSGSGGSQDIQQHDAKAKGDEDAVKKAMKDASEQLNEEAEQKIDNIQINEAHAARTSGKTVPDRDKPVTAADVKDICGNFTEVRRQYRLTEKLPSVLAARGRTLLRKNQQYFKSLSTPNVSFLDSGSVDPSRIYGLSFGDTEIFRKKGMDKKFDGCAYILIDNSGSMMGEKRTAACQAAALIEESFRGLIPMKIVAFDEDYNTIHEVIKGWDEQQKLNCCWNFDKYGRYGGGTPDGFAIQIATKEILDRPEQKKMIIIICDGGGQADLVKEAVRFAKKQGIHVNSILIEEGGYDADWFKSQYASADNAVICSPAELDGELSAIMKKFSRS